MNTGDEPTPPQTPSALDHLVASSNRRAPANSASYSRLIRWMRLVLPLIALAITAVVFTWDNNQTRIAPMKDETERPTIGKNELLNPRFESVDGENRPYRLTAKRAAQDEQDETRVLLEKPVADMMLEHGHWLAIEATEGTFQQEQRKLWLRGQVRLFHDGGYQLETPELQIDIEKNLATSEKDVHGQGPEGTLEAHGLRGSSSDGTLIFTGPAKLVLNTEQGSGSLLR